MEDLVALIREVTQSARQETSVPSPAFEASAETAKNAESDRLINLQRENERLREKVASLEGDLQVQTKRNGSLKCKLVDAEDKLAHCRKSVKEFETQLDSFMGRQRSAEDDTVKRRELEQQNGLLHARLNDMFE